MKIKITEASPPRKLIAVVGCGDRGYYLQNGDGTTYINSSGIVQDQKLAKSLEQVLSENSARTPIYEGDTLELSF